MINWLREPLVHFLVLGAALFVAYELRQRHAAADESSQIAFSAGDVAQLAAHFESENHRPPTAEELDSLVEARIEEEVLYREALRLGLDRDDALIKARLAEKMRFFAADISDIQEPTDAELQAYFQAHTDRFIEPSRVTFRHIYFSNDRRGVAAKTDAETALPKLAAEPKDSQLASTLADSFMFLDYYNDYPLDELASEFGQTFCQAISTTPPGSWAGPLQSAHGWHLVFVDRVTPARTPDFAAAKNEAKTSWLNEQQAAAWQKSYQQMRDRYTVARPTANQYTQPKTTTNPPAAPQPATNTEESQ
jgi:hypothetical protein